MKKFFRFCQNCGKPIKLINNKLIDCSFCGFHFYLNPVPTTAIILENEKGEILFVKRKFPPKKDYWDLPGGFVEFNETGENAIKREVKEEINLEIKIPHFLGSYVGFYPYKGINYQPLCLIFYQKINDDEIKKLQVSDDAKEIAFFHKTKIPWEKLAFIDIKEGLMDYLKFSIKKETKAFRNDS